MCFGAGQFFFFHGKNSTRCWKPSRGEDSAFAFWRASLSTCRFVSGIFVLRIIWKTCTSIKGVAHCECLWINVAEIVSRGSVTCWKYALHTKQTVAMKRCLLSTKVEVNTFTMPLSLRHLSPLWIPGRTDPRFHFVYHKASSCHQPLHTQTWDLLEQLFHATFSLWHQPPSPMVW